MLPYYQAHQVSGLRCTWFIKKSHFIIIIFFFIYKLLSWRTEKWIISGDLSSLHALFIITGSLLAYFTGKDFENF